MPLGRSSRLLASLTGMVFLTNSSTAPSCKHYLCSTTEIPGSNLVPWQGRYGKEARPHQPLFEAKNQLDRLSKIERCFFKLYRDEQDEASFADLIGIFGRTYPLLAYFFFLKDRSRYLPIAPTFFDRAFDYLGVDFKTSHRCSWENYSIYVTLVGELKTMLAESLAVEVSLLDAHTFAWILIGHMERENKLADVQEYLNLSSSEREAVVKARIGQGIFRDRLIAYWSSCAVTGCKEEGCVAKTGWRVRRGWQAFAMRLARTAG